MDFEKVLHKAIKNERKKTREPVKCYRTTFSPPKKEEKNKGLTAGIQRFLAKKEEEERRKRQEADRKREELLALRNMDNKAKKRVQVMLKRTKSANKSVLQDAIDEVNTADTINGPDQCDEDDYGYVSQEASSFYKKMMEKYSATSAPTQKSSKPFNKGTSRELLNTKDRVRQAISREEEEEGMPHKRKRRSVDDFNNRSRSHSRERSEERERSRDKPKPKRPAAPPPLDFNSLLKIAEKKQFEPIVIEKKETKQEKQDFNDRPMTKKEKLEYEKQKERERLKFDRSKVEKNVREKDRTRMQDRDTEKERIQDRVRNGKGREELDSEKERSRSRWVEQDRHQPERKKQSSAGYRGSPEPKFRSRSRSRSRSPPRVSHKEKNNRFHNPNKGFPNSSGEKTNALTAPKISKPTDSRSYDDSLERDKLRLRELELKVAEKERMMEKIKLQEEREERERERVKEKIREKERELERREREIKEREMKESAASKKYLSDKDRSRNQEARKSHKPDIEQLFGERGSPTSEKYKSSSNRQLKTSEMKSTSLKKPTGCERIKLVEDSTRDLFDNPVTIMRKSLPNTSNTKEAHKNKSSPGDDSKGRNDIDRPSSSKTIRGVPDKGNTSVSSDKKRLIEEYESRLAEKRTKLDDRSKSNVSRNYRPVQTSSKDVRSPLPPKMDSLRDPKSRNLQTKGREFPPRDLMPKQFPPKDMKPKQFPPRDLKPKEFPPRDLKRRLPPSKGSDGLRKKRLEFERSDSDDSDEEDDFEYDDDLDDFIDDGPEGQDQDYSKYIRQIFGYDKSKYNDDFDDDVEESNFAQQMREECRSARIGRDEDLRDMALEMEEKRRKALMRKRRR